MQAWELRAKLVDAHFTNTSHPWLLQECIIPGLNHALHFEEHWMLTNVQKNE